MSTFYVYLKYKMPEYLQRIYLSIITLVSVSSCLTNQYISLIRGMCSLGFTNDMHWSCSAATGRSCKNTQRRSYMQNVSLACEQATSENKTPKTKPKQTKISNYS